MSDQPPDEVLGVGAAAKILGISRYGVHKLIAKGTLRPLPERDCRGWYEILASEVYRVRDLRAAAAKNRPVRDKP